MSSPSWLSELLYSQWKKKSASRGLFVVFLIVPPSLPLEWLQRKLRLPETRCFGQLELTSMHLAVNTICSYLPNSLLVTRSRLRKPLTFPSLFCFYRTKPQNFIYFWTTGGHLVPVPCLVHFPTTTHAEASLLHLSQSGSCPLWSGFWKHSSSFLKHEGEN